MVGQDQTQQQQQNIAVQSGLSFDHLKYAALAQAQQEQQIPLFTNPWAAAAAAQSANNVAAIAMGQMHSNAMSAQQIPSANHSRNASSVNNSALSGSMSLPMGPTAMPTLAISTANHLLPGNIAAGQYISPISAGAFSARSFGSADHISPITPLNPHYPNDTYSTQLQALQQLHQIQQEQQNRQFLQQQQQQQVAAAATSYPQKFASYPGFLDRRINNPSVPSPQSCPSNYLPIDPIELYKTQQASLIDMETRLRYATDAERQSFVEALDASRGVMNPLSDITPRNIYGDQGSTRSSIESYGFPPSLSQHSSRGSVASTSSSYAPSYHGSSVSETSYCGGYDSGTEDYEDRKLSLVRSLGGTSISSSLPITQSQSKISTTQSGGSSNTPESMMGSFQSKVSSYSQKKHKCKVCDKRFTRPSSLQTHMYSHTGEKRKTYLYQFLHEHVY